MVGVGEAMGKVEVTGPWEGSEVSVIVYTGGMGVWEDFYICFMFIFLVDFEFKNPIWF